jgi:hypothetical protein
MNRLEAHRFLDNVRAGRIDAKEWQITEALKATGDYLPTRLLFQRHRANVRILPKVDECEKVAA